MIPITFSPATPSGPSRGECVAVIVRHGQTAFNRQNLFRGRFDVPLDATGLRQAGQTASLLASGGAFGTISAVYSGPLSRARDTATPLAALLGLEVDVVAELDDADVGRWQGRPGAEVATTDHLIYQSWRRDPARFAFPGGESLRSVAERTAGFIDRLRDTYQGRTVVLFTHQVPAKLIVLAAVGIGPEGFWRVRIDNCSISAVKLRENGRHVLTTLNCTAHLTAENEETGRTAAKSDS